MYILHSVKVFSFKIKKNQLSYCYQTLGIVIKLYKCILKYETCLFYVNHEWINRDEIFKYILLNTPGPEANAIM